MADFRPKYDDQPVYHNTSGMMMKGRGPPLKPPIKFAPAPATIPRTISPRLAAGPGVQERQLNDQEGNSR